MTMYRKQHPFSKQAAFQFSGVRSAASQYLTPSYIRNSIMNNIPEILAGAAGLAGGAYIGNKSYQNAVPPVKALPRLNHEPLVQPYYQNPMSAGNA